MADNIRGKLNIAGEDLVDIIGDEASTAAEQAVGNVTGNMIKSIAGGRMQISATKQINTTSTVNISLARVGSSGSAGPTGNVNITLNARNNQSNGGSGSISVPWFQVDNYGRVTNMSNRTLNVSLTNNIYYGNHYDNHYGSGD